MRRLFPVLGLLLATLPLACAAQGNQLESFVAELSTEHDLDADQVRRALGEARKQNSIIKAITRPAEGKPWHAYRKIFLGERRIREGVDYWDANAETLARAEREFGVPAQIIVAIIGVETFYGGNTGGYRVLDALYTLGFHYPPRQDFFRSELGHFLLLAEQEGMDPVRPKGSYAGAMGKPQFMPSSYLSYAIDFSGDGKRDIWETDADVIGSVANYLARHGWQRDQAVLHAAKGFNADHAAWLAAGYKPHLRLDQVMDSGIEAEGVQGVSPDAQVALLELVGDEGPEHWLVRDNFYSITRYNHSQRYAMAVYQLGSEILALRNRSKPAVAASDP